jgi:hypothetical protein
VDEVEFTGRNVIGIRLDLGKSPALNLRSNVISPSAGPKPQ